MSIMSLVFMAVTLILTFFLPIVVALVFAVRNKSTIGIIALGAVGFYVPQMIIRIPIITMLGMIPEFVEFISQHSVAYSIVLGISAAVFELAGRLGVLLVVRKRVSYIGGIAAGLGHGVIESVALVGITYIANIMTYVLVMANVASAELIEPLLSVPAHYFLLAGVERIAVIVVQIALTLLVFYGYSVGKLWQYALLCLLAHSALDVFSALIQFTSLGVMGAEVFIVLFAIGAGVLIYKLKGKISFGNLPPTEGETAVSEGY